jgi:hypothetical protein
MKKQPRLTPLGTALLRAEADMVTGREVVGDQSTRHIWDSIQRMRVSVSDETIDQFSREQECTVNAMLALLNEWADLLKVMRLVEREA